ncbi:TPA: EamA/RhaT family transporter, partial [Klebsiella pneumoniae]
TLVWSMVIGYLFLNSLPGSSTLIGAGIVALAGIFTLWCDQRQRRAHIARASS